MMDFEQLSIHDYFSGEQVLLSDLVRAHVYAILQHPEAPQQILNDKLYPYFLKEIEKGMFSAVLINTRGNQAQASQFLGISRLCLHKKLKKYKRLS